MGDKLILLITIDVSVIYRDLFIVDTMVGVRVCALMLLAVFFGITSAVDLGHVKQPSEKEISLAAVQESWTRWVNHHASIKPYWDYGAGCTCDFKVMCTSDYECNANGREICNLDACCGTFCLI